MEAQALLVDLGGVLTTPEHRSFQAFCRRTGADLRRLLSVIEDAYPGDRSGMVERLELGLLRRSTFERWLASELWRSVPRPPAREGLIDGLFAEVRPEPLMYRALERVRELGIRTAIVSNSWGSGRDQDAVAHLVDLVVVSARVGMRKPEPGIYLLTSELLGLPPRACVFVDDLRANAEGARRVGMRAILHRSPARTVAALERVFGVSFR